jgi:hypothetical protein
MMTFYSFCSRVSVIRVTCMLHSTVGCASRRRAATGICAPRKKRTR